MATDEQDPTCIASQGAKWACGTASTYRNARCRGEACRAANAAAQAAGRERRRLAVEQDGSQVVHGSYGTYVNHGCRCTRCKAANAEAGRRRRAAGST